MNRATSVLTEALRIALPLAILAAGVLAFAAIAGRSQPPSRIEPTAGLPAVETVAVEAHDGGLEIDVDGTVVPHREISLSAEIGGRITQKSPDCRAGRFVTAGTLLVEIDPRKYALEVERLEKEVEQAAVNLQEIDVEIGNAQSLVALGEEEAALQKRHLQRVQQLHTRRAASETELDEARRAELASRNSLTTLRNQLRTLETRKNGVVSARELTEARLAQARLDLERTEVRAPIDGMVVSESVEEDSYVQPGSALFTIEDTSAVEVRCSLRMEELNWLWLQEEPKSLGMDERRIDRDYQLPRTPVTVVYQLNGRRYSWDGVLSRYEGIGLDQRTRTVPCRVLVPNPRDVRVDGQPSLAVDAGPRALVRGMYVRLTVHARPRVELLRVPESSVQPGNVVWRVRDGRLNVVPLRNIRPLDDSVLVPGNATPLEAGDQIVVTPLAVAVDGMAVQVTARPASGAELTRVEEVVEAPRP